MTSSSFDGLSPFSREYRERLVKMAALIDNLTGMIRTWIDQGDALRAAHVFPAAIVESKPFPADAFAPMFAGTVMVGDVWFYRFVEATIRMPTGDGAVAIAPGDGGGLSFSAGDYGTPNALLDPAGFFKALPGGRTGWALNGLEAGNTKDRIYYGTGNAYSQGPASVELFPVGRSGATVPIVMMLAINIATDIERPPFLGDPEWQALLGQLSVQYLFCAPNPIKPTCTPKAGRERGDGAMMLV